MRQIPRLVICVLLLTIAAHAQTNTSGNQITQGGNAVIVTAAGALSENLAQIGGNTVNTGNGTAGTGTLRVSVASDSTGTSIVTQATASNLNAQIVGAAATDAAVSGNPIYIGGRSNDAVPTAVTADAEAVPLWLTRRGAMIVAPAPHIALDGAPFNLISKTVQTTTTQTGSVIWTPTGGKKLVIVSIQIQAGGTTAGTVQVWFEGSNGDTTYTRGTDPAVFDGEFAPSSTSKPGFAQTGIWIGGAADFDLRLTTSAAVNPLTITVWGYEI